VAADKETGHRIALAHTGSGATRAYRLSEFMERETGRPGAVTEVSLEVAWRPGPLQSADLT
jgi:hypothetical protein